VKATELASVEKAAEEAQRIAGESAVQAQAALQRVQKAVEEAGLEDVNQAREAMLDAEQQRQLEQEVAAFRQERHTAERRVAELGSEIEGQSVTEEELASEESDVRRLRQDYQAGLERRAALGQEIKELGKKVKKATELATQRETLNRSYAIYHRLSDDLRSEHFQAYLLEEAFRELVEGASERLKRLSGRYTLEYSEDSFLVLDHDNAGARRSADTLSGGETFLASLALALELSVQVQRAAGAVNLDSLFIDEGFGTLDPETLDTVAVAIESLPVGGRMVGIITHIPELTERLPACIRIEKTADGSRLRQ
jgi:exonuclease SbcC